MRYVLHISEHEATYAQVSQPAPGAEEEGLVLHRQIHHQRDIAFALTYLVNTLLLSQGKQARVDVSLEEGLAFSSALGDKDGLADVQALRGQIALNQGELPTAYSLLEESVHLYRELDSQHRLAETLAQLARVDAGLGEWAAAQARYEESLTIGRALNNAGLHARGLEDLARLAVEQGAFARAAHLWGKAEALRQSAGVPLPPLERIEYDRAVASARSHLGETAFAAAWELGRVRVSEPLADEYQAGTSQPVPLIATAPVSFHPIPHSTRLAVLEEQHLPWWLKGLSIARLLRNRH